MHHDGLQERDAVLGLLARQEVAHRRGEDAHGLGARGKIHGLATEQKGQGIARAGILARHRQHAADPMRARDPGEGEALRIDLREVGENLRALLEDGCRNEAVVERYGEAAEMIEDADEIMRPGRHVMRGKLEPVGMRRLPAREGAVGADMLGHAPQARGHRRLEVGRRQRRTDEVIGKLEASLGQVPRRALRIKSAVGRAMDERINHKLREIGQHPRIAGADFRPRLACGNAERAKARAVGIDERHAGEESDVARPNRGVIGEARVGCGIGDQQHVIGAQGMIAEDAIDRIIGVELAILAHKKDAGLAHRE